MLLWKVILFQNFTHSATDHALKTFPFANPQPPGLGEMRHHLFTSHCEYPHAESEPCWQHARRQKAASCFHNYF